MANNRLDVTTLENWLWKSAFKIRVNIPKGDDSDG
jgi:hypothetical protein